MFRWYSKLDMIRHFNQIIISIFSNYLSYSTILLFDNHLSLLVLGHKTPEIDCFLSHFCVLGLYLCELSEHRLLLTEGCEGDAPDNPDRYLQLQQLQQQAHSQGLCSDQGLLWQGDGLVKNDLDERFKFFFFFLAYSAFSVQPTPCVFCRALRGSFVMRRRSSSGRGRKVKSFWLNNESDEMNYFKLYLQK